MDFKRLKQTFTNSFFKPQSESPSKVKDEIQSGSDIIRVFENQRWRNELGWTHRNLEVGDPKRFVNSENFEFDNLDEVLVPDGWEYVGAWYIFILF